MTSNDFTSAVRSAFSFLMTECGYFVKEEQAGTSFDHAAVTFGSERLRIKVSRDRGFVGYEVRPIKGFGSCDDETLRLLVSGATRYQASDEPRTLESLAGWLRENLDKIEALFAPLQPTATMKRVRSLGEDRANVLFSGPR